MILIGRRVIMSSKVDYLENIDAVVSIHALQICHGENKSYGNFSHLFCGDYFAVASRK